ncbi:MAG: BatA domain-containing protein, partial [Candidatus Delongbacteria bacterium]|nr:BatA domain-containing protein [Candidatus Delongbacteria bacterium]
MRFDLLQYLYFLPLSVLPLVIYLIFRKKPKKVIFGSLFLLKNITKKVNRRTRLKDIILLILRTLFVIFLILLFARPFTGSDTGFDPSLDNIYAVYLDSSPSMADRFDGGTKLDAAKNILINSISDSGHGDVFFIFTSDPDKNFRGLKDDAVKFISDVGNYGKEREFHSVYAKADSVLHEEENRNRIFLSVTDGFIKTDKNLTEKTDLVSKVLILRDPDEKESDISVESADLINRSELSVKLFSEGNNSARLDVFKDGKKINTTNVDFGNSPERTVRIEAGDTGNNGSLITLKTDDKQNPLNNTFHLTIPALNKKNVLITGDKNSFSLKALISLINTGRDSLFNPDIIAPDMINSVPFNDYELIVFSEMSSLNSFTVKNLKDFLNRSGSVYFVADEKLNLNDYNANLIKELKLPQIIGVEKLAEGSFSGISVTDSGHPVFKDVFLEKSSNPTTVEIYSYYKFPEEDWEVLVKTSSSPLLLEKEFLNGRIFLLSAGLGPENSNILRNGIAVPLLLNAFHYLTSTETAEKISYLTGDRIEFEKHRYLSDASKKSNPARSEFSKIFVLKEPGFYRISEENGTETGTIAVNSERETTINETEFLSEIFGTVTIDETKSPEKIDISASRKHDLSNFLLLSIALILISEILIV